MIKMRYNAATTSRKDTSSKRNYDNIMTLRNVLFFGLLVLVTSETVEFSQLSKDIQISSGGSVFLRCVTRSAVEKCRWSLTPVNSNTTVVVKEFLAAGEESRDCSVRLSHALAEQEGLWTCAAKVHGQENYTDAPPTKLSLLEPPEEAVTVAMWSHPHQKVVLACIFNSLPPNAECEWIHEPDVRIRHNDNNRKDRRHIRLNITSGMCTLQFNPSPSDFGVWICKFSVKTENGDIDLGTSALLLIDTVVEDSELGWIVGAATSIVLFLMILTVTLVVCRGRVFDRQNLPILETVRTATNGSRNQIPKTNAKLNIDYSRGPRTGSVNTIVVGKGSNRHDIIASCHHVS